MKQLINRLPSLVIVIATTMLALALGILLIYVITFLEERGRWEKLDTPPGDVIRLIAGDEGLVTVETANGDLYEIYCRTRDEEDYCVREVETPRAGNPTCDQEEFALAPPRDQVRQRLKTCFGHEYLLLTQYILREDGSLWRWNVSFFPYGQLARFFQITVFSIIIGIGAGIIIVTNR